MSLNYVKLAYVDDNSDDGLMIEAVRTSETSANFNETTWRYLQKAVIFTLVAVRTSD
jgi:hypothetical protein